MNLKDRLGKLTDKIGITESIGPETPPATPQDNSNSDTVLESASASAPPPRAPRLPPAATEKASAQFDKSAVDSVRKSIEQDLAKKFPEAYSAFAALTDGLADVITDEATRIKAALVGADKQGHKGRDILQAYESRLADIDEYEKSFKASVKRKMDTEVAGFEQQALDAEKQIKAKQEEIAQLQSDIAELGSVRVEAQDNAKKAKDKISAGESRVSTALSQIREQVETERQLVSGFVKGGK